MTDNKPITVAVPIYLDLSTKNKKNTFSINLNIYRNAYHHELDKAKKTFHELVKPLLKDIPILNKVKLTYILFFGSNRRVDTNNICSIVDKFFSDTLVDAGVIDDDHCGIVYETTNKFGGIDKDNPRVEVILSDYELREPKEKPMRIILTQSEIEDALKAHVAQQLTLKEGQNIGINLKPTRGEEGVTAEIDIGTATVSLQTATHILSQAQVEESKPSAFPSFNLTKENPPFDPDPAKVEAIQEPAKQEIAATPQQEAAVRVSEISQQTKEEVPLAAAKPTGSLFSNNAQTSNVEIEPTVQEANEVVQAARTAQTTIIQPVVKPTAPTRLFAQFVKPQHDAAAT